jgi:hypothetical protein
MDTARRHLLRSTLLAVALPRLEPQDAGAPLPTPEAPPEAARQACVPSTFVDHRGWIIPPADRDALQAGRGAGGPAPRPGAGQV